MKKVFVVSLFLVSIFLISSSGVALAIDGGCACYQCTVMYSCGEGITEEWEDSVEICAEDGHANIGGDCWGCDLGGRSLFGSNKKFEGLGGSCWGDTSGCSVELRGRASMTVDLYDSYDCMTQWRCAKGGECADAN